MNELTVIIPFLNEGEEIYNTVKNLRETAGDEINIILINDASEDGYDYEIVANEFATTYIHHPKRRGVAASRDEGIDLSPTEFFLLLDGHMRFFQTDWVELIVAELHKDKRALFCCQSISFKKDEDGNDVIETNRATTYGAYIDLSENGDMQAKWNTKDPDPEENVVDIVCLLGAAYACNKSYWKYLGGLKGLRAYDLDEQFISIKVWMEGGRCRLLKHVGAGHLYRNSFPYKTEDIDLLYNKFLVAELFLPREEKYQVFEFWEKQIPALYKQTIEKLVEDRFFIREQSSYYQTIFNCSINDYLSMNRAILKYMSNQ